MWVLILWNGTPYSSLFGMYREADEVGPFMRSRLIKDRPRFTDTLDTIKFICKEVWVAVWDKQVDNLRTNHRVRLPFVRMHPCSE